MAITQEIKKEKKDMIPTTLYTAMIAGIPTAIAIPLFFGGIWLLIIGQLIGLLPIIIGVTLASAALSFAQRNLKTVVKERKEGEIA